MSTDGRAVGVTDLSEERPDLGPRFRLTRRLGMGAFGIVYEAFDDLRESTVALKILRRGSAFALYRFKREFRSLADMSHPNLVQLYELHSNEDRWFFTMELVEGRPFLDVASRHALEATELRALFAQLAAGVLALHDAGMLHCDIKPSNALVTPDHRVVLLDFGLLRSFAPAPEERAAELAGTPAYMAPEQVAGRPTAASDWYSVGVMLYEALVGAPPFTGTALDVLKKKQRLAAPRPVSVDPSVPADLDALCAELLARDPAARPPGTDVLRRLRSCTSVPVSAASVESRQEVFVGRAGALSRLREAYDLTRAGSLAVAYVRGPSGMGKTALVRRFAQELAAQDPPPWVLFGKCHERESVPYKAIDGVVDGLAHHLASLAPDRLASLVPPRAHALGRLFPVLASVPEIADAPALGDQPVDSLEQRRQSFLALRDLLGRVAREHTLVLVVDDLHWGDADSAVLLDELMRPPDAPPFLLIGCYRGHEAALSPVMSRLLAEHPPGEPYVREVALGELPVQESYALVRALDRHEASAVADIDAVVRESGGHPLFIEALVGYSGTQSATLAAVITDRVARLPAPPRRLLEVLALAGAPLPSLVAKRASGLPDLTAMSVLRNERLIRARAGGADEEIEIYHDRIRETVAAALPANIRRAHHGELASALDTWGRADPETLAIHFEAAGRHARAAGHAVAAARGAAATLAFDRAARLYRQALRLVPDDHGSRRELLTGLGDALAGAGRGAESAAAYQQAADGAPPAERWQLLRRVAQQLLSSGRIEEGRSVLRRVLAAVGMRMPETPAAAFLLFIAGKIQLWFHGLSFVERPEAEVAPEHLARVDAAWCAAEGLSFVHTIHSAAFQTLHLVLALRAGEPHRVARALAMEVMRLAIYGSRSSKEPQRMLGVARALAERLGDDHLQALATLAAGTTAYLSGRWREGVDHCSQAHQRLRRSGGTTWEKDTAQFVRVASLLYMDEVEELARGLPALQQEARERGDLYMEVLLAVVVAPYVHLAADRPAEAARVSAEAIARWPNRQWDVPRNCSLHAQVETALYAGDAEQAWRLSTSSWPHLRRALLLEVQILRIICLSFRGRSALAMAAEAQGSSRRAFLRHAERDAARIARERVPWGDALAAFLRAAVCCGRGLRDESRLALEHAERGFHAAEMKLHAAVAARRLGELLLDPARVQAADAVMHGQGIVAPEKMARRLLPWFRR